MKDMTAQEIKKAIVEKAVQKRKPVEEAEIFGIKGHLFKSSVAEMEDWRRLSNDEDPMKARMGPAKLVQISFRDIGGNRVFEDLDVTLIGGMTEDQIYPLYKRCLQINGYGIEAAEAILKNLRKTLGIAGLYDLLASINAPCPNCANGTKPMSSKSSTSASDTGPPEAPPKPGGQS